MKKVLILGASGLVGRALVKSLSGDFEVFGTYNTRQSDLPQDRSFKMSISNLNDIRRILKIVSPEIVISCLTGDFNDQLKIHKEIANHLNNNNGKLYFCSTTNVFDNDVIKPHYEEDTPNSNTDYGKYKIKCENEMKEILKDKFIIFRLPMIWGKDSPRLNDLLNDLKNNNEITIYTNLYKNSNTDIMLSKQINYIIKNDLKGIFHLGSDDLITHNDFILKLVEKLGYDNPKIINEKLPGEKYYFAVLSNRNELPNYLRITNEDVIKHLIQSIKTKGNF